MTDDRERSLESNPTAADSDKDGFSDGFEDRFAEFGFNLAEPDADREHDGLTDRREAELGTDPTSVDTDGDGWGDFDEELNRQFGYDPTTKTEDADFDGLADELEARLGSSPNNADSNDDGISDFQAYAAGLSPVGERLTAAPAELIGITYGPAMAAALRAIRARGVLTAELARQIPYGELPYPDVTAAPVARGDVRASAALMQRSLYNPHNSPGIYPSYAEIEQDLAKIAAVYNGSSGPDLVRLFYWTGQTQDTCDGRNERGGRRIYAMKVSKNPGNNDPEPEVAFFGVHHARELVTGVDTMRLLHTLTDRYATDAAIRKLVDTRETWVIAVVNPNGYDRAIANQLDWRKNTHLMDAQNTTTCGVDVNRNYGFEHVTSFPPSQRAALKDVYRSGVDPATGNLVPASETYPGPAPFSEVETQAVRGLAHSQFLTERRKEVDGLVCTLSWHSFGGVVGHPMSHVANPPNTNLNAADVPRFDNLTKAMALAAGYVDVKDGFPTLPTVDGCLYGGYATYGDSDDWFYKDGHTFSILIEDYSKAERGGCPTGTLSYNFYPLTAATRDAVASHNVEAALALLRNCPP